MEKTVKYLLSGIFYSLLSLSLVTFFAEGAYAQKNCIQKEAVYRITELPPKPNGGMGAFYAYTEDHIERPLEAVKKGVKGKVFVQFVIEKDGELSNIKVLKGLGCGCDEAVVKCLQKAPKWIPGKQKGKTVRVRKTLAIQVF